MNVEIILFKNIRETEINRINELAKNSSVYDQPWYLSLLNNNKVAVFIYGDFHTVLLVPYKEKWGIRYAVMPHFVQKLNFLGADFGKERILHALVNFFKYGQISFHLENVIQSNSELFDSIKKRTNYILQLNSDYTVLRKKYGSNHKRNCSKLNNISIKRVESANDLIEIFEKEKKSNFTSKQLSSINQSIRKIVKNADVKNSVNLIGAFQNDKNIANALFLEFNERIYYILGSSIKLNVNFSDKGLFAIFDWLICTYSNTLKTIDFEGSDIPGVARFFKGFGSEMENYYSVKWNRLPFPLNLIKR